MDAITAIELCEYTYLASNYDILQALNKAGWNLAWICNTDVGGNTAFLAQSQSTGEYAVAIRGSLFQFSWEAFENWFEEDFNVFVQVPWQYGMGNNALIAQGASDGLANIQQLVGTVPGFSKTLLEYLLDVMDGKTPLSVVGHSLGGNLASVVAPWLNFELSQAGVLPPMSVYTFAAPAAGNQVFASGFDNLFSGNSWRYILEDDIVPYCPVTELMALMSFFYVPSPSATSIVIDDGVTLQEAIAGVIVGIEASEIAYDSYYTQTNADNGFVLMTTNACDKYTKNTLTDWFDNAACNHSAITYYNAVADQALVVKNTNASMQ